MYLPPIQQDYSCLITLDMALIKGVVYIHGIKLTEEKGVKPMWTERFRIRPVSHCKEGCCS